MGKCTIIGRINAPASLGQAVRINGKKCDEVTTWNISAFGGESVATAFTVENRSSVTFSIDWEMSTATDTEYTLGVYESDGVTPVSSPATVGGQDTKNWKFGIVFDKYITEEEYDIYIEFDFA